MHIDVFEYVHARARSREGNKRRSASRFACLRSSFLRRRRRRDRFNAIHITVRFTQTISEPRRGVFLFWIRPSDLLLYSARRDALRDLRAADTRENDNLMQEKFHGRPIINPPLDSIRSKINMRIIRQLKLLPPELREKEIFVPAFAHLSWAFLNSIVGFFFFFILEVRHSLYFPCYVVYNKIR